MHIQVISNNWISYEIKCFQMNWFCSLLLSCVFYKHLVFENKRCIWKEKLCSFDISFSKSMVNMKHWYLFNNLEKEKKTVTIVSLAPKCQLWARWCWIIIHFGLSCLHRRCQTIYNWTSYRVSFCDALRGGRDGGGGLLWVNIVTVTCCFLHLTPSCRILITWRNFTWRSTYHLSSNLL